MPTELTPAAALLLLATVLAWPALLAAVRRTANRHASEVAAALESYSNASRIAPRCVEIDPALAARIVRLGMPEFGAFRLAPHLPHATPALVADAAARLALR